MRRRRRRARRVRARRRRVGVRESPRNECENATTHRMKHKMNVTDHHQTLCCVREGHTPIQFLGTGWPSSSYSSSDDEPSSGARSGCSTVVLKMRSSDDFLRVGPAVVSLAGGVVRLGARPGLGSCPGRARRLASIAASPCARCGPWSAIETSTRAWRKTPPGRDRPGTPATRLPARPRRLGRPRVLREPPVSRRGAAFIVATSALLALLRRLLAALGRAESHGGAPTRVGTCDFGRGPRGAPRASLRASLDRD